MSFLKSIRKKPVHLKNILLVSTVRCFVLLALIVALCVTYLAVDSRRSSQEYVSSLASSMDESLNLVDSTLQTVGRYLSTSETLTSFFLSSANQSPTHLQTIYDTMDLTVIYSDIIQDIAIVSPDGMVRSFYNSYSLSYIDQLKSEGAYDFSSTALSSPRYFFFPDFRGEHDPMFIYLFPLISTSTRADAVRIGTVVLACRQSALESILKLDLSSPYRCTLEDESGREVVSATGGDFVETRSCVSASLSSSALPLKIHVSSQGGYRGQITSIVAAMLGMMIAYVAFTLLYFSRVLRQRLVQPIHQLVEAIPALTSSHQPLSATFVPELDVIVGSINRMVAQLEEAHSNAIHMQTELLETQLRNNEAELYALQSQINPHFLFNTLQCVRSLAIIHGVEDISAISSALSAILRYSIREMQQVSLREEMNIVRQYLKIIDIRYQNRFSYEIEIADDVLDCACPCMIIQPLVENAIIHGVAASDGGGTIRILGRVEGGVVHIEVADNGAGISAEKLAELQQRLQLQLFDMMESHEKYGKSFGLLNIQRRIQLQYGEEYGLTLLSADGWTRLMLRFPAVKFVKPPIGE